MAETKHIIDVARFIENNHPLLTKADAVLASVEHEVLIAEMLKTSQSACHHGEGVTVRSHVRLMLTSLMAIVEGHVRLTEIEEFVRLKGYEEEILEMQQTICENAATFEVFCLVHDLGKPFRAAKDAKGEWHYHGHEKDVYRKDILELIQRLAATYKLTDHDVEMLVPLVSYHMEPLRLFSKGHDAKGVKLIEAFATDQGVDADDFIDMLQACVLLDQVLGSRKGSPAGGVDAKHLVHFFLAEREYAPWKLEAKEKARALERKRSLHKVLADAGLDGHGVMMLTGIKAGPVLGGLLKRIQESVLLEEGVVGMGEVWKDELDRRIVVAREKLGSLGERSKQLV